MNSRLAPTSKEQARRRRVGVVLAVVLVIALVFLLVRAIGDDGGSQGAPAAATTTDPSPSGTSTTSTTSSADSSSSSSSSNTTSSPTLPDYRSTGDFSAYTEPSGVRGSSGQLVTYRVEVEDGSGVSPRNFARAVDNTLSNDRGWTAGGQWRFQRVATDTADLTIRLATPDVVDEYCARGGFDTRGEVSCTLGSETIMLNLDRWYIGVEHIDDLGLYRDYLVNHEVGHAIGKPHQACPGKGETAPVMLQQTLDLEGCEANAWPYSPGGELIKGPVSAG